MSENPTDLTPDSFMAEQPANWDAATAEIYAAAHRKHPDFAALEPAMLYVARALPANWAYITLSEYLECLYAITRHADFVAPVRDRILFEEAVPVSPRSM